MTQHIFISLSEDQLQAIIQRAVEEALKKLDIPQPKAPSGDDLLTIEEAAGYLNLAVGTLYEKTSKKLIPFFKRDKKLYFRQSELEAWITEKRRPAVPKVHKLPIPASLKKKLAA